MDLPAHVEMQVRTVDLWTRVIMQVRSVNLGAHTAMQAQTYLQAHVMRLSSVAGVRQFLS